MKKIALLATILFTTFLLSCDIDARYYAVPPHEIMVITLVIPGSDSLFDEMYIYDVSSYKVKDETIEICGEYMYYFFNSETTQRDNIRSNTGLRCRPHLIEEITNFEIIDTGTYRGER